MVRTLGAGNGDTVRALPKGLSIDLLRWFDRTRRPLPWRRDRDPYRRWVAEVLLQQTTVAAAIGQFDRFLARFPDVAALARASEEEVLKRWEGWGYYARARHLHEAAGAIVRGGRPVWPSDAPGWRTLPGVGPYIAAAVASQSFGTPDIALDSNGRRVAARWTRVEGDPRSGPVGRGLERRLAEVLPIGRSGDFNEALMELGETICRPIRPRCEVCPVARHCRAFQELGDPALLSLPRRPRRRPTVRAAVVALEHRGRWLVQRRDPSGLLGGLWEFPGGKIEPGERPIDAAAREVREETGRSPSRLRPAGTVRHSYSHFDLVLHLFSGVPGPAPGRPEGGGSHRWVTPVEFERLPRPAATIKAVARLSALGRLPHSPGRPTGRPGTPSRSPGRARS